MMEKTILILCDGMTNSSMERVNHPFYNELKNSATICSNTQTVFPPVTLPCHISLFHSICPERHGTTTNTYSPMVRPVDGLFEQLSKAGKEITMIYSWEELRDCAKPGCLNNSIFHSGKNYSYKFADKFSYEAAKKELESEYKPDFIFLYLGNTDAMGHFHGWESKEFDEAVFECFNIIENIFKIASKDYSIIITADHGGHDRDHGKNVPEDMTIPLIISSKFYKPGFITKPTSIIDIAPTIANIMNITPSKEWEGSII